MKRCRMCSEHGAGLSGEITIPIGREAGVSKEVFGTGGRPHTQRSSREEILFSERSHAFSFSGARLGIPATPDVRKR